MFNYVGDISDLAHNIIKSYLKNFNCAIDATLGNGYDTDFLSQNFNKVFSFDIQKSAIESYKLKNRNNVVLINNSHERLEDYAGCSIDCIMYNLGFLPGGDKSITTTAETTLSSINEAVSIINPGGIITIAIYTGHDEGKKEREVIMGFVENLPKGDYGVMLHSFINRNNCPELIIIERNCRK